MVDKPESSNKNFVGLGKQKEINYDRDKYYREQMEREKSEGIKRSNRVDKKIEEFTKHDSRIKGFIQKIGGAYDIEPACGHFASSYKARYRKIYQEYPDLFEDVPDPDNADRNIPKLAAEAKRNPHKGNPLLSEVGKGKRSDAEVRFRKGTGEIIDLSDEMNRGVPVLVEISTRLQEQKKQISEQAKTIQELREELEQKEHKYIMGIPNPWSSSDETSSSALRRQKRIKPAKDARSKNTLDYIEEKEEE